MTSTEAPPAEVAGNLLTMPWMVAGAPEPRIILEWNRSQEDGAQGNQ